MGILGILGIIFVVLKLVGVIAWSWWVVLIPYYGIAFFAALAYVSLALFAVAVRRAF